MSSNVHKSDNATAADAAKNNERSPDAIRWAAAAATAATFSSLRGSRVMDLERSPEAIRWAAARAPAATAGEHRRSAGDDRRSTAARHPAATAGEHRRSARLRAKNEKKKAEWEADNSRYFCPYIDQDGNTCLHAVRSHTDEDGWTYLKPKEDGSYTGWDGWKWIDSRGNRNIKYNGAISYERNTARKDLLRQEAQSI